MTAPRIPTALQLQMAALGRLGKGPAELTHLLGVRVHGQRRSRAGADVKTRPILFSAPMVRALLAGTKTQTRRIVKPQPFANGYHDGCIEHAGWVPGSTGEPACARFSVGAVGGSANLMEARECPYGTAGDRLWVRETCLIWSGASREAVYADDPEWETVRRDQKAIEAIRRKDPASLRGVGNWKATPSIHMPRWASRLTLEITDVRVERLWDISEDDALAEGITYLNCLVGTEQVPNGYREIHADRFFFDGGDDEGYQSAVDAYAELWESINGAGSWAENPWVWALTFKRVDA